MVQGKAFSMGGSGSDSAQNNRSRLTSAATGSTPTYKSWMHLQDRTFLIEELPYQRIAPQLAKLPMTSRLESTDMNLIAANSILGKVSSQSLLPPELKEETDTEKSCWRARTRCRSPAWCWTMRRWFPAPPDFTFQSNDHLLCQRRGLSVRIDDDTRRSGDQIRHQLRLRGQHPGNGQLRDQPGPPGDPDLRRRQHSGRTDHDGRPEQRHGIIDAVGDGRFRCQSGRPDGLDLDATGITSSMASL